MRKAKAQPENSVDSILRAGQLVDGKYRIERLLGEGGMAAVWAGTNERTGKRVALKVILRSLATTSEAQGLFHSEALAASRVNHPNVVTVFDVIEHEGMPCIVMELLDGEPLGSYIASRGFLTASEATAVLLPAMRGVAAAHAQGVIHRDLKPQNIFICIGPDGRVVTTKVLDFGISVMVERAMDQSAGPAPALARGTPAYMSPEQLSGSARIDVRADVYGFGVLLYEALTGQMPFTGAPGPELFHRILNEPAPPLAQLRPDLPPGLVCIIERAMAKKPGDRYANLNLLLGSIEDELAPATPAPRMLTPSAGVPDLALRSPISGNSSPVVQAALQQEPSSQSSETQLFFAPFVENSSPEVLADKPVLASRSPSPENSNPVVQAALRQEPSGQFPDTQLFIAPVAENNSSAVPAEESALASPSPSPENSNPVVQDVLEQEPSGQLQETQIFGRPTEKDVPAVASDYDDGQADDERDDVEPAAELPPPLDSAPSASLPSITVLLSGLRSLPVLRDRRFLVGAGGAIALVFVVWMVARGTGNHRQATPAPSHNATPAAFNPPAPPALPTAAPAANSPAVAVPAPAETNPAVAVPAPAGTNPAVAVPAPAETNPTLAVPAPTANNPAVAVPARLAAEPSPAKADALVATEHRESTRQGRAVPASSPPRRSRVAVKDTVPAGRHAARGALDGHAPALNPPRAATASASTKSAPPAPTASPSAKSASPRAGDLSADDF